MELIQAKHTTTTNPKNSWSEVEEQNDEAKFIDDVRRSANKFENLVMNNSVTIFSTKYWSYFTVAKQGKQS